MIIVDAQDLDRLEKELAAIPKNAPKALSRALNEALARSRTISGKLIREAYKIKQADIYRTETMIRASAATLTAILKSNDKPLPLFQFGVVARKTEQVVVEVLSGKKTPLAHAFAAITSSGRPGIFHRVGAKRFPIAEEYTLSIPSMLVGRRQGEKIRSEVHDYLFERLKHQIDWLVSQKAEAAGE